MEGAALRHKRELDMLIAGAWHTAIFGLNGYAGKLRGKNLSDYLNSAKPKKAQTPDEMFAALLMTQAGGAPLNIRKLN